MYLYHFHFVYVNDVPLNLTFYIKTKVEKQKVNYQVTEIAGKSTLTLLEATVNSAWTLNGWKFMSGSRYWKYTWLADAHLSTSH